MAIAYLSNQFPEETESYVWNEIHELQKRDQNVVICSFRRPRRVSDELAGWESQTLYVFPVRPARAIAASWILLTNLTRIRDLLRRAVGGPEPPGKRVRTLVHTWLGACLAMHLRNAGIEHIHVHHGFFSSWAGMVAARILGATFSMTLHGSDLLLRADYIDTKLKSCLFCVTISDFNRQYIWQHYPECDPFKVLVHRIGIDLEFWRRPASATEKSYFSILSVGRLHAVKNHGFLLLACRELKTRGVEFRCAIAGDGPERENLVNLISAFDLSDVVQLLGTISAEELRKRYAEADVVVLTSHSEGISLALMEAMAMERVVLAPAITGMHELISNGRNGFLYRPDSLRDFLEKLEIVRTSRFLGPIRGAARSHIAKQFNRELNLRCMANDMLARTGHRKGLPHSATEEMEYANSFLQQVQLPVQRNRSLSV